MANNFERNELSRRWANLRLPPLVKKMIEIYSVSFASSALFTALYFVNVLPQGYIWCVFCAAICIFLNFIWLAFRIKRTVDSGMNVHECRVLYLKVFAIHAAANIIMAAFGEWAEPVYTFLFLPYKLFCFGVLPRFASAIIMNGVMSAANYVFPAVPFWLSRIQQAPIKKNAMKMRKFKKAPKKKQTSNKVKRRTIKFSKKGGKKR